MYYPPGAGVVATKVSLSSTLSTKLLAHIETSRPYTVIWCGLVSLAGACLTLQQLPSLSRSLLITFIPMMGWVAGLYLTDFFDRTLDSIQKPHRPIPSGRIHRYEAVAIGGVVAVLGFSLSFLLNWYNVLLVFPVAVLVFTYAKYTKSRGIWGNINRGVIIIPAFFFGVFAVEPVVSQIPMAIWLFSLVFFLHDTNSNLIGALRDVSGDKQGGYRTLPVKYGMKASVSISIVLCVCYTLIILGLVWWYAPSVSYTHLTLPTN